MQSVEESTETTRCVDVFTKEIDESPDFLDFLAEKPSVDILDPVIHHSDVDDSPVVNGNILMNGNPIKVHSTEYNNSIPNSIYFDAVKEKNLDLFEFFA
ncbi:hypothetical protein QYM36_012378 [Artemia franciscana]|uniref:Uncharacterized protein n=1 Tax=Artemia franciscana TaxID=6661 RepID=A0AA88L3D3_ARTSF|nr:hypothetical protein QYM36_012378 [Artemia franciscana]